MVYKEFVNDTKSKISQHCMVENSTLLPKKNVTKADGATVRWCTGEGDRMRLIS